MSELNSYFTLVFAVWSLVVSAPSGHLLFVPAELEAC